MQEYGTIMIDTTGCTITLYTQDRCRDSDAVRTWLLIQSIPFTESNVTHDSAAATDLASTGIFATPLVTVCKHVVFGNNPGAIARTIETCEFRGIG
jgi:hypothetical protein